MERAKEYHIFRAYDIRGVYGKELTDDVMEKVARAFARCTKNRNIVVARDGRGSSPGLKKAFVKGLLESGKRVIDAGLVPLGAGMLYACQNRCEYAFITASHLPKEWNGVKFFHPDGTGFMEDENSRVRDAYFRGKFSGGKGFLKTKEPSDITGNYIQYLVSRMKAERPLRVVIDAGNGAASAVAGKLFRKAGFFVKTIFDRVDGSFPNRMPDPMKDPLKELCRGVIKGSDMGIAYDGDGDRVAIVDEKGRKLSPEQVAYIILSELLKTERGGVVANVECTRVIDMVAKRFGRRVIRVPVGHTFLTEAVHREKACFGVEVAGHYVVRSVVPFDDSLAVSLYFAVAVSRTGKPLSSLAGAVPVLPFERVSFYCEDRKKFRVISSLKRRLEKEYGHVSDMDGVRVDFPDGWALVRASNTEEKIRLSVEANTPERLREIRERFSGILENEIKTH